MDRSYASVDEYLAHYGVKGMRWGVRKSEPISGKKPKGELVLEHTFKSGDRLSIYKNPPNLIAKTLSRLSKNYAKDVANYPQFTFRDKDGTKVGVGSFVRQKDELYLDWMTVKAKHRGKGYASAAMKGVVKYAQDQGVKKLTLEVPGNAPDARHIYEKLGFKLNGKNVPSEGPHDPWGGLKGMEYKVPSKSAKHADISPEDWEEQFAQEFAEILINNFGESGGGSMAQFESPEEFLKHFGIKGMKWGVRKKVEVPADTSAAKKLDTKTRVKKNNIRTVSDRDLQQAINRMQLEQNFKRLAVNEKSGIMRWVSSTLMEIGKREVQAAAAKKAAAFVAKKFATGGTA